MEEVLSSPADVFTDQEVIDLFNEIMADYLK